MRRLTFICFSKRGALLAERIAGAFSNRGYEIERYIAERHAAAENFTPFASVYKIAAQTFNTTGALVFIGACGIAVRAIAPLIGSKLTDPAVVVCDETGRFAVSLLSGHAGGANELAGQIAEAIGAVPVITTASDSNAAINGETRPRNLVLGIGCRKGLSAEVIERAAVITLWDAEIPLTRVCEAATIDVKRNDAGLTGFMEAHGIPLRFYSAEELACVPGAFSSSERVLRAVGVDNVCERAAVLCGGKGKLILQKTAKDGVTVAVFEREEIEVL